MPMHTTGVTKQVQEWSVIGPALLQGVADIKEIYKIVTEVLDSMFCVTLP